MEMIEEMDTAVRLWAGGSAFPDVIFDSSDEKLFQFAETMALSARHHTKPKEHPNQNFSFTANISLSGGPHPCSYPDCRVRKLDELVAFATLYADEIYIDNPFETIMLAGQDNIHPSIREEVSSAVIQYLYLKPLIEAGVIKYAQKELRFCRNHLHSLAEPLISAIAEKEDRLIETLASVFLAECKISLDVREGAGPYFLIEGTERLVEHGSKYLHLRGQVPDFVEELMSGELPHVFSRNEIEDHCLLSLVVDPIAADLATMEWHSTFFGTSYLLDNNLQAWAALQNGDDKYRANSAALSKAFEHTLPAVYSNDLEALMSLREAEGEAFSVYRDKLHGALKESKGWEPEKVASIFLEEVLPEINRIDHRVRNWRERTKQRIKDKVLFGAGTAVVGLYAGTISPNAGAVLAALGGYTAVSETLQEANKLLREPEEARESEYYFLWKAQR